MEGTKVFSTCFHSFAASKEALRNDCRINSAMAAAPPVAKRICGPPGTKAAILSMVLRSVAPLANTLYLSLMQAGRNSNASLTRASPSSCAAFRRSSYAAPKWPSFRRAQPRRINDGAHTPRSSARVAASSASALTPRANATFSAR